MRPAMADDLGTIQQLVFREFMNPLGLAWQRFLVAEAGQPREQEQGPGAAAQSKEGVVVGVGQLKAWPGAGPTAPPFLELRSLVVDPAHRGQGIGSRLVGQLLSRADAETDSAGAAKGQLPVFLLTIGKRVPFYERLGFQEVTEQEKVPKQLGLELSLGGVVTRLVARDRCLCMKLHS